MLAIVNVIAPVFLLVGIGFLCTRLRVLDQQQIAGLGQFVVLFALPALILKALLERPLGEFIEPHYLLAYGGGSFLVFWLSYCVARALKDSQIGSVLSGLGSSVSNSGFIAYPMVSMVVGHTAVLGLALCMLIENLLMIPMALAAMDWHKGRDSGVSFWRSMGQVLLSLGKKPLIHAMALGVIMSLLDLRFPVAIMKAIDMLALAASPVAIFVIGASLQGVGNTQSGFDIVRVGLAKLIVHPLVVLCLFYFFPVAPELHAAGVLFAAAPMMSIFPIIGQLHGFRERCAATLVVTTLGAFLTLGIFMGIT